MIKKNYKFYFILILFFFISFFFVKKGIKTFANQILPEKNHKSLIQEECNPEKDPDCKFFDEETNQCDVQYEECIEKCNDFEEKCFEACEKKYIECIDQ